MLFDTVAGERYRIIATTPTGSPANVRLELHQACQDTPEQEQNQTFSPGVRLTFDAPQSAAYRLKTTNDPPNVGGAEFAYTIQIERVQPAAPTGALILIAGKLKANDPLQPNIHHVTNQIYQLFQSWGYTHEQINYLATDQTLDADGDGSADVDAAVTTEALEEAITSWAPSKVGPDRPLTIYIVDHGEHDLVYLDGTQQELATPAQIDDWLAKLERQQPDVASRIIIESCYSGSFINLVEKVSKVGRIIITSTDDQNDAYASENGVVFSDYFISALAQGQDFSSSFQMAHDATTTANTDQTPWIDANGNGIPNEEADYIPGTHTVVQPAEERWPPYIKDVALVDTVQNERGQIQASVLDDQAVQQVWAEIYAPSYTPPPSSSELVRPTVPSIVLNRQTGTLYQGVYDSLDEAGTYRVVLHAIDNEGLRAQPVELQITVRQQRTTLYLPLVQR
jgi:hypothetical protein